MKPLSNLVTHSIPQDRPSIVDWAEEHVRLPSSVRSNRFDISISPWIREPLERAADTSTRIITFVKPVQSAGSVAGEIALLYWIQFAHGFLQYNWSNDKRAFDRWESRVEAIINSCAPVKKRLGIIGRYDGKKCEIDFGSVFFRMQGAFISDNLDSDSVALQINEEVHSWEPGHLKKARNRSTAVWNFKSFDISNASKAGDQLEQAFRDGTMQRWIVKCPGCHEYHYMRTRWEDKHPELGGLRYEAKREDGSYDYNRLRSTIHFQMPCGYIVPNDTSARRELSLSGVYSTPTNTGAELSHRSYTYEAVSVDYIDWVQLVKDKHDALYALRNGDPEPWRRYRTERECLFYDIEDAPLSGGSITLTTQIKKNRDGIADPKKLRLFALDRQMGEIKKREVPHWWLAIRDFVATPDGLRSLLVYEGKLETDDEVIRTLDEHQCIRSCGVADSGDDTMHVYLFCMRNGISAIKGGKEQFYSHQHPGGSSRKIYSPERPLHAMINMPPLYPYVRAGHGSIPNPREPMFWLYSKFGIRERLHYLRQSKLYETPGDVSDDYQAHQDAEERTVRKHPRTGEPMIEYIQIKRRNDLYVCEAYIAMLAEMAGLIGIQPITTNGQCTNQNT